MLKKMRFRAGETITIIRPQLTVDPYSGEEIAGDWDTATRTEVPGVGVGWSVPDEQTSPSEQIEFQRATLYTAPGVDIKSGDRIELPDGTVWDVVGDPMRWRSPFTGWRPGDEIRIERRIAQ